MQGLGEPGWRPGEHIMWCQEWNLRTFTFIPSETLNLDLVVMTFVTSRGAERVNLFDWLMLLVGCVLIFEAKKKENNDWVEWGSLLFWYNLV